eukprot:TRINITY_DN86682_c0_g1_i1.p1 TRINITY_DN86682_c0_g1~~TRINITY_DN86682_c0_g1_i1.p1  ORF type:complete len:264 (+),score=33.37 TRINITY_DN86682_c0_g1_i1:139-930(+)
MVHDLAAATRAFARMYATSDLDQWTGCHMFVFVAVILVGPELVSAFPMRFAWCYPWSKPLELQSKHHLDTLSRKDWAFIIINKLITVMYVYHILKVCRMSPHIYWPLEEVTFANSILALFPLFCVYDLLYALFHNFLHRRFVYGYIHKHHHQQVNPSRGHHDAMNVHPIEFIVGEYLHLIAFYFVPCHVVAVIMMNVTAAMAAALNHSHIDIRVPLLWEARDHNTHHRALTCNFGQYTMFWDKVFGWYQPYCRATKGKEVNQD